MVTQKDVAERAGVSFITVSRVVNGESNVKEETKQKVLRAIADLGYAPGFAGRALNSGRVNTIAVLTPIPFYENVRSFYLMLVLSGIEQFFREKNIDILIGFVPEVGMDASYDYLRPYRQKKVDGIIFIGMRKIPDSMIKELELRHLPCVAVGDRPESSLVSWVDTDNYGAGYSTIQRLWENGHRRIAFCGLDKSIYNANVSDRERGFVHALKDLGAGCRPEDYIIRTEYKFESIERDVFAAFSSYAEIPTALFCSVDSMIPPAVSALAKLNLSVPRDVSAVGFDGFINTTYFGMDVTTNVQPLKSMGHAAAEMLYSRMEQPGLEKQERVLPVSFYEGKTVLNIS